MAGALTLILVSSPALHAQTREPDPKPRRLAEWKLDDISRARWIDEDPKSHPVARQQAKKKSHHALAVMLIGIGGAVAGGLFGSTVWGSLCECDDRAPGAAYGALFGGAIAGIVTHIILR